MTDPSNAADNAGGDTEVGVVSITRTLKATPEQVFEAWTDADQMKLWLYPAPGIYAEADCDPVVGGHYRLVKIFDWGARVVSGEYLVVEPPHRLVFTWAADDWGPDTRPSQITVTLLPDGDATEMTIVHEQLPNPRIFGGAKLAWVSVVDRLEETLRTS